MSLDGRNIARDHRHPRACGEARCTHALVDKPEVIHG